MSPRQSWPASWTAVRWPGNPRVHGVFTSRDGGLSRGSCACAAATQKSKARMGANLRIGDFTVDKGKEGFFEC